MAMADAFRESKWIWLEKSRVNQYADFIVNFAAEKGKGMVLHISADTNYAVYVNGEYVYSGQYPDYPHYKIYDELNIEQYCHAGKTAWRFYVIMRGKTAVRIIKRRQD